jgi:hypothetical protein
MNTPKASMLALAARTLGSPGRLADLLGVTTFVLADWMSGDAVAPDSAYFAALDIVAKGPYHRRAS